MKLSKAQIRALETVAAGKVWDEEKKTEWLLHPAGIRTRIIFDLEDFGLIAKQRTSQLRNSVEWRYKLTEAGRKALEEATK